GSTAAPSCASARDLSTPAENRKAIRFDSASSPLRAARACKRSSLPRRCGSYKTPCRERLRVEWQAFEFGEPACVGRHRLQRVVADRDHVRALDEVVDAERREESRAAAGGENVIG